MGKRFGAIAAVCAVVALWLPARGASATESAVSITSCGQVITTDAVLRRNLDCSGDALTVEASNLTVRLGGHTISSTDGTGAGIRLVCPIDTCDNDVDIRDGTIEGFSAAVTGGDDEDPSYGRGERLEDMKLIDNTWGIYLPVALEFTVDHTTIEGINGIGKFGPFSGSVQISRSRIAVSGVSLALSESGLNTVDSSRVDGGSIAANATLSVTHSRITGVSLFCGDVGVEVSTSVLVDDDLEPGPGCAQSYHGDRFAGPGSGVAVALQFWDGQSITDSDFTGWSTGVVIRSSRRVVLTGNTFRQDGVGVEVTDCSGSCSSSGTISDNRFVHNTGTGVLLPTGTWDVGSNTFLRNGGLGIDAEGPDLAVIDDGGNVARRNLSPQCIGVVCTR